MKFLVPIDLVQNELQNAVIQNLASAPANGKAGQLYFNTTDKLLYQHDGTAWKAVGGVYELPAATADTLGGIKVGGGLQITETGVLSATGGGVADSVEWTGVLDTPTTIAGYGIVDAKIEDGTITLGTETITPVTSVNGKTGSSVTLTAGDVGAQVEDFVVTITANNNENWTADKTSAELNEAYDAGKNIKIKTLAFSETEESSVAITAIDKNNRIYYGYLITDHTVGQITLNALGNTISISTNSDDVLTINSTNLTNDQKAKFRSNIGAGTSNFSGSFNDLTDQPTIDTALSTTSTNAVENKAVTTELNKKYDSTNQPPYPVTSVAGKTGAVTLAKTDVGLDKVANVLQYSAENEPPYPVTSVDGATGAVVLNDVKYTEQTLSEAQKTQARANIGAGTSSFSGKYADLDGLPTVDTAMSATSTNAVQNKVIKAYVDGIVAASQGIVYKGIINSADDVPTTYNVGDLYMIATAGTYVGQVCEVGDLMIAVVGRKGTGNENSDWDVIQTNIEGAITEITGDSPISVTGTGASREIALENSGVTTGGYGDTTAQTPAFGEAFKVPSFTVDQYGRLTAAGEHTVTIPKTYVSATTDGIMGSKAYKFMIEELARIPIYNSGLIQAGETSVSISTAATVVYSVTAANRTTGEGVMVDWKKEGEVIIVSIASPVSYDINIVVSGIN